MAFGRDWGRVLAIALGAGALTGAGQLGLAYGLGLIWFDRTFPTGGLWSAQQTWVVWFAAVAVLGGAGGGVWAARRYGAATDLIGRIAVVLAAGVGAMVVVPLVARPARLAVLAGLPTTQPSLNTAVYAVAGVLVGLLTAVAVLSVRLIAVSVTLLVALAWLVALVSAAPALGFAELPEVRLGVLDLPALGGGARSAVAVLSAPVLALLVCGSIAAAARSRGLSPLLTAVSVTAAPGLLALVYLIGSPGTGNREIQVSPYAGALLAVAAGLLVALLVGVARLPARRPATPPLAPPLFPAVGTATPVSPAPVSPTPVSPALVSPAPVPPTPVSPTPVSPTPVSPAPAWPLKPFAPVEPLAETPKPVEVPRPVETLRPPPEPRAVPAPFAEPVPDRPAPVPPAPVLAPAKAPRKRFFKPKEPKEPKPPKPPKEPKPPKPPKEPKPPKPPKERAKPAAPPPPVPAPAPEPPRPPRRGEDEHVDWISSLANGPEDDDLDQSRRRLRKDGA